MSAPLSPYVKTLIRENYEWAARDLDLGERLWGLYSARAGRVHPMGDLWWAALSHYYGDESTAGRTWGMTRRGNQGELSAIRINRARRVSKARQALILAGFIKLRAVCGNMDAASAYAKTLAELLLDYDFRRGGMELLWSRWVEQSEVLGDAFTFTRWNRTKGRDIGRDPDTGLVVREGDVDTCLLPPWRVHFDDGFDEEEKSPWHIVETDESKVDLILEYQRTLREQDNPDRVAQAIWDAPSHNGVSRADGIDSGKVCIVNAIHKPTRLLPNGLLVRMIDAETVLERRPLLGPMGDYDEQGPYPVIRLAADMMMGQPHAWAPFWNVLAAQELSDALLTSHATLVTTYNDPIYALPIGAEERPSKLSEGPGRTWKMGASDKGKPELIERPEVKESALNFDEVIAREMQADMALNDAVTGQVQGTEKNAQAEALRASQAVQQVAPAAKAARRALSQLFELRLKTLRKNANGERLLRIVGQAKKHLLINAETFTGEQLAPFESVEFEDGNPMEATPQGRWAVVELYSERGLLKSVEDIDMALATGRLEPVVDPIRSENLLIQSENDLIRQGQVPHIFDTHNHVLHMRKHDEVTFTPQALQDGDLLSAHQQHWTEHYMAEFGVHPKADPLLAQRRKYIAGLGPDPAMGMPPGGGAPPPGGPHSMPPNGPAAVEPPQNPLNGEQFSNTQPPQGGGPA